MMLGVSSAGPKTQLQRQLGPSPWVCSAAVPYSLPTANFLSQSFNELAESQHWNR